MNGSDEQRQDGWTMHPRKDGMLTLRVDLVMTTEQAARLMQRAADLDWSNLDGMVFGAVNAMWLGERPTAPSARS